MFWRQSRISALLLIGLALKATPAQSIDAGLAARIDHILNSKPLRSHVGIEFRSVASGTVLYARGETGNLIPASVTKVVTSIAALSEYGGNKQFVTPILYQGRREGSTIIGDLVIIGGGDPLLTSELLWTAAADLRNLGIKKVTGRLLIDNRLFLEESLDRIEGETDSQNAYDAPITALGVNFNTVEIAAAAAGKPPGSMAHVEQYPYPIRGLQVESRVKVGQSEGSVRSGLSVQRLSPRQDAMAGLREKIVASGSINEAAGLRKVYRSVHDPAWVSGEIIREFLAHEGIVVAGATGKVKVSDITGQGRELMQIQGYPLSRILQGLNHYSNNYIADVLTKDLGVAWARRMQQSTVGAGSFANGVRYISDFLQRQVGLKPNFVLRNGSGLSTENRFTAAQINEVLLFAARNLRILPDLLASLASAGETGTLRKRFQGAGSRSAIGVVRAKTGTLSSPTGVATLAGYFLSAKHGMIAFTILENGGDLGLMRNRQDEVVAAAVEQLK